jgi:hypothetical protein
VLLAIGLCAFFGLLGAYSIASEPFAYVASMLYGIYFLYLLIPAVIVLFVASIVAATFQKTKYAATLFISCLMLPIFFIGSLQAMRALGFARYETNGLNEMRPIDEQPNGNVIVVYQKGVSFVERERFANEVVFTWKEGRGFTGETGVQSSIGLNDIDGRTAEKLLFDASASETKKEKLRLGLAASSIVYRFFENLTEAEVRDKLERKESEKKL